MNFEKFCSTFSGVKIIQNVDGNFALEIFGEDPRNKVKTLIHNKIVTFRASDFSDDEGQKTVPFFNAEDVIFDPPIPAAGMGLMYVEDNLNGEYLKPFLIGANSRYIGKP